MRGRDAPQTVPPISIELMKNVTARSIVAGVHTSRGIHHLGALSKLLYVIFFLKLPPVPAWHISSSDLLMLEQQFWNRNRLQVSLRGPI